MLKIGSLVDGKYRVLKKCGQGGMSVVYMAINERANKIWAIKEIRKEGIQNYEIVRQGLLAEANLLKRLKHPHLPSIIDVIDKEDCFLIMMDFIEGKTLTDVLKESGPVSQEEVIEWTKQLCDVLGYLHTRTPAVIYRDMKPSNIMLKPDGNVVLFDFGAAREYKCANSEDTICLGTRGYAAPEQYGGCGQTDVRTDIYCLGATMYHLLTGHNPAEPPYEMYPVREWNPALSAGLEAIVLKCTQKNPEDRYQSCSELRYALEHYWETDTAYRKKQLSSFKKFAVPVAFSFVFGAAALLFWNLKEYTIRTSYDSYLSAARNSATKEEEIENYHKAINLDPYRSEGYRELLQEAFLDDRVFTRKESEELRKILIDYGDGKNNNENVLKRNSEGYERFAYDAGIAYFYKFEERENKKNAKGYFGIAKGSKSLSKKQRERAQCLHLISSYYSMIGIGDETGDASVTYADYWEDLTALSEGNLVETDNERTALIMYQELVSQMVSRAADFQRDGVTFEEMQDQIKEIRQHLRDDFSNIHRANEKIIEDDVKQLKRSLDQAERILQSSFHRKVSGGGKNNE